MHPTCLSGRHLYVFKIEIGSRVLVFMRQLLPLLLIGCH